NEHSIRYARNEQRSQGMYPPIGSLQTQPEVSFQGNTSMPLHIGNALGETWQGSDQFIAGYHMPIQHHDIQQTPLRKNIVTSPNEVISMLVEKVRGLELAQVNHHSQLMQVGNSNPSQIDLLTGIGTLGVTPQYSQQTQTRTIISNTILAPPGLVQNNPFVDNTPSYLNMYSKSPQGDMFSSPGMIPQTQGFPYAPANAYTTPYQQPIPPPLPQ
ncbi:hypothetical protein KI387_035283, partial [Taxus chinensis]